MIKRSRPTIGFFVQESSGLSGFQNSVWKGMIEAARARDVNAVVIEGGMIDHNPDNLYEKNRNLIYRMEIEDRLDGLIIEGTLGKFIPMARFREFCESRSRLPIVSIFGPIQGYSSVCVDNRGGLRDTMLHLVHDHHFSRIAFIRGWPDHTDAKERFAAYLDTLGECGIAFDPELVYEGDYTESSGERAVEALFSGRERRIEAIIASNDDMALGAMSSLRKLKKNVPGDVAVTGFDDTERSRTCFPPLTTVRQPFAEIGQAAIDLLLNTIGGRIGISSVTINANMIIRQSCGCPSPYVVHAGMADEGRRSEEASRSPAFKEGVVKAMIDEALEAQAVADRPALARVALAFMEDAEGLRPNALLTELGKAIADASRRSQDLFEWTRVVSSLKRRIPALWTNAETLRAAANRVSQAFVMIGEAAGRAWETRRIESEGQATLLRDVGQALATTFDLEELKAAIGVQLGRLGIPSCFISLFREMDKDDEGSETFLAYADREGADFADLCGEHKAHALPPEGFFPLGRRFAFNAHALYFRDHRFGYILFELGPEDGAVYDTLQVQIGSAIMGARLLRASEDAYSLLKENQAKLLISEKMASLGRLVAGIAHEMNTPLATVRVSIEVLEALAEEYFKSIDDPKVLPEDHRAIAGDMRECLRNAKLSIERSASFIRGIKGSTTSMNNRPYGVFIAAPIVQDTLGLLGFVFNRRSCGLETRLDEGATVYGDPQELNQIVTNLINNSVEACVPGSGVVIVSLERAPDGFAALRVRDNGSGIAPENISRIFDPMFTTKPFGEGTGLGLSIVHELVEKLKGSIEVESAPGNTLFSVMLPSSGEG